MNTVAIQHKHTARVLLHEARIRRGAPFSDVLLRWAGNVRQRAASAITQSLEEARQAPTPTQQDLFA